MFALWGWNVAVLYLPGLALLAIGTTVIALNTEPWPEWYRWVSTLLLLAMVVISGLGAPGFATGPGFLWMMVTSLMLTIRRGEP